MLDITTRSLDIIFWAWYNYTSCSQKISRDCHPTNRIRELAYEGIIRTATKWPSTCYVLIYTIKNDTSPPTWVSDKCAISEKKFNSLRTNFPGPTDSLHCGCFQDYSPQLKFTNIWGGQEAVIHQSKKEPLTVSANETEVLFVLS